MNYRQIIKYRLCISQRWASHYASMWRYMYWWIATLA